MYQYVCSANKNIFNYPLFVINLINVRFEAFTAVTMKNVVFWDVAICRSCVNQRFGDHIASIFRVEKSASGEPA
jgi:hypothetical protein